MVLADDFGQQIVGLHAEGETIDTANERHIGVFGKDSAGKYAFIALDTTGQVELAHDVNTNPIYNVITDGTDDLAIYNEGDAGTTGFGAMGQDSAGNMQFLKTTTDGELIINVGAADSAYVRGSVTAVKDTPAVAVTESPVATTRYSGVIVSGFGKAIWDIKFGVTASEAAIITVTTTPADTTRTLMFPSPIECLSTETLLVEVTNKERRPSTGSDFTAYATLIKEA